MKLALVIFLVVFIVLSAFHLDTANAASGTCDAKCEVRCSKARVKKRCLKYCGICCEECNSCVPSGTFGNKDECPCYRDKKNSKGEPKCP